MNWFKRLKPQDITNSLSDIIYNNVARYYLSRAYIKCDYDKYLVTNDLLQCTIVLYDWNICWNTILRDVQTARLGSITVLRT